MIVTNSLLKKLLLITTLLGSQPVLSDSLSISDICSKTHCIAVFDIGSTGSRLSLLTYKKSGSGDYEVSQIYDKKISPELNSLSLNQQTINQYLDHFSIQHHKPLNIPTYFYATAGMRFLSHQLQTQYYEMVSRWFESQSVFKAREIRTISGREEGVFGWLSVFDVIKNINPQEAESFGLMDMGGGSNQITFPVHPHLIQDPMDLIQLHINNKTVTLYSKSFLGLGNTSALQQFLNTKSCFLKNYQLPNKILAEGCVRTCFENTLDFINQTHQVNPSIKPMMKNNKARNWYVMGALGYLAQDKSYDFSNHTFTPSELLEQSEERFCKKDWNKLHLNVKQDKYFYTNCFRGAYYYALLVNGYGLKPDTKIQFLDKSSNTSWMRGAVLYKLYAGELPDKTS